MSADVQTRPEATDRPAGQPADSVHGVLLGIGVLVAAALVFGLLFLITALAGGDGFPH